MRKSVILLIGIIFIASVVVINFFGMKMAVYNEVVQVETVKCLNENDPENNVEIDTFESKKLIKVKFGEPANKDSLTGTMLQLEYRVYPDNASNKEVKFVYAATTPNVEFYKNADGKETGLILFYGLTFFTLEIISIDGRGISETVYIWAC